MHLEMGALFAHPVTHTPEYLALIANVGIRGQIHGGILPDFHEGETDIRARPQVDIRNLVNRDRAAVLIGIGDEFLEKLLESSLVPERITEYQHGGTVGAVEERRAPVGRIKDLLIAQVEEVGESVAGIVFGQERLETLHIGRGGKLEMRGAGT